MSSIARSLRSGETVLHASGRHWVAPLRASAAAVAMLLVGLMLWLWDPSPEGFFSFVGGLLALVRWGLLIGGATWIAVNIVSWRMTAFAVTSQRVLRREGLGRGRVTETALAAVVDAKLDARFPGRILGYGDVRIMTQPGDLPADTLACVANATEFRHALMSAKVADRMAGQGSPAPSPVGQARGRASTDAPTPVDRSPVTSMTSNPRAPASAPTPAATPASASPARASAGDQAARLVRLAELRDRGLITSAEFEAKKAEILARI
jgi:hypothetical protein